MFPVRYRFIKIVDFVTPKRLLEENGDIKYAAEYPKVNRHPAIWVEPSSDKTKAGLKFCLGLTNFGKKEF